MNGPIRDAIAQLAGTYQKDEVYMVACTVTDVNEAARTCTCTSVTGKSSTDLQNVQLMAEVDDGMLLVPSIDSTIIVGYSKRNVPYVALFSQIDKVVIVTGNSSVTQTTDSIVAANGQSTFTIKNAGYSMAWGSESMRSILSDLMDQIMAIQVPTNTGVSGTPLNASSLSQIKQRIQNILYEP
ncbi:MAG TPA: hypothetical protein VHA52_11360 [Candidatus Babeliaceae bacterium]|nr:hypothetical protein [Candidatus Babeliaceae bacterium]